MESEQLKKDGWTYSAQRDDFAWRKGNVWIVGTSIWDGGADYAFSVCCGSRDVVDFGRDWEKAKAYAVSQESS